MVSRVRGEERRGDPGQVDLSQSMMARGRPEGLLSIFNYILDVIINLELFGSQVPISHHKQYFTSSLPVSTSSNLFQFNI